MTEKPSTTVLYKKEGKVAIITLNRPQNYNAITHDLILGILDALTKVQLDEEVRAVILTGNGKGFCAGADMSNFGQTTKPEEIRDYLNTFYGSIIRRMINLGKPIIGAINGPAAGAGLGFALACDFRIMAETANMRYAFINIGLTPDNGSTWFLARTVGYSKALEIAISGEKIPAEECLRLGLTNKIAPTEKLMKLAMDYAQKMADCPTIAFAATKRSLNFAMTNDLISTIAFEAEQQINCLKSKDHQEGVMAFLQKRKPEFIGK